MSKVDNQKKITKKWLRKIGFTQTLPCNVHGAPDTDWTNGSVHIWQFNDTDEWLWVEHDARPMKTRGCLLTLIKWLEAVE